MVADRFRGDIAANPLRHPGVAHLFLAGAEGSVIPHAPPTCSSTRDATQPKTGRTRTARIGVTRRDGKTRGMIAEAPRVAEETTRRQREELLARASEGRSRLDVSVALQDKRWGDEGRSHGRRKSLRKERREGRIIFLVLVIALGIAIIWLVSHLHF